jgi:beta-lactamase superfamily II metal-dependent hydrolase
MSDQVKTRRRRRAAESQITIRMYNVGFGDCFLVRITRPEGDLKVLFDCGTISNVHPMDEIIGQVVKDVTDSDGVPRIDVVVGTHRHRDHVSGFAKAQWAKVEVREVWMPWTEDPKDDKARNIRDTQSRLAAVVADAFARRIAEAAGRNGNQFERHQQLAFNALTNESAMRTLHEGFAKGPKRRFLPKRNPQAATFETDALPGVIVHVMGPSRDEKVIRDMDPPAGQSYMRSLDLMADGTTNPPPNPFRADWWLEPDEYRSAYAHLSLDPADQKKMKDFDLEMVQAAATSLDKAVNGTSLMLMFQLGDVFLLFPGDAQWGTWQAAMKNPEWLALLKRTTFYKVGHHGSHNATPVEFIENTIEDNIWAMVSTGAMSQWPLIPRIPLLEAISKRTNKLTRSDQLPLVGDGAIANGNLYGDITIPFTPR